MNPPQRPLWHKPLGVLVAAACLLAAAGYFGWWRPLVIASLRISIDNSIKRFGIPVNYESLSLHGIGTIVVKNLSIGNLDDPDSAVIKEARLSFSIPALFAGRFDVAKGLSSVILVGPQVTISVPRAKGHPLPPIPYLPRAGLKVKEGKILLRKAGDPPKLCTFSDIELSLRRLGKLNHDFRARFTPPGSGRRSFAAHGTFNPAELDVSVNAKEINLASLSPWLEPLELPVNLGGGGFSSSLRLKLTRTSAAEAWSLSSAWGKLDLYAIDAEGPAMPLAVRGLTGRIDFSGTEVTVGNLRFRASEIAWTAGGTVSDISSPVFGLNLESKEFDLSKLSAKGAGKGTCKIMVRGTFERPEVAVEPDLRSFSWSGFSLPSLQGRIWVLDRGELIRLDPAIATTGAGVVTVRGETHGKEKRGEYTWILQPVSKTVPAWNGTLKFNGLRAAFTGRSKDDTWSFSGKATGSGKSWRVSLSGKGGTSAAISGEILLPVDPAKGMTGRIDVKGAGARDFYLHAFHPILSRAQGSLAAGMDVKGSPADPVLELKASGGQIKLDGFDLPVSAEIRISRSGVRVSRLTAASFASAKGFFPFSGKPPSASVAFSGAPLSFVRLFTEGPDWSRRIEGELHGDFTAVGFPANPRCSFKGSLRRFSLNGTEMGLLEAEVSARRGSVSAKRLALRGPAAAAEGSGIISTSDSGWRANGNVIVSYLKAGLTDVEAVLWLDGKGRKETGEIHAELKSVRLNGSIYPDAKIDYEVKERGDIEARASWEDLFSGVAGLRAADGGQVSFTAAFSDLPMKAVAGIFSIPSPVDKVSGSVKLKGPRGSASLNSSLRWRSGETEISGAVDTLKPGEFAAVISMVEADLASWLQAARRYPYFSQLPDIKGRFETRSLSLKRQDGRFAANGWVTVKDLRIEDREAGKGSFRIAQDAEKTELEAAVDGPFGNYVLYPTRITGSDDGKLEGSFSWKDAPAGKALSSCAKAAFTAQWTAEGKGEIGIEFSGIAINEESIEKLHVRLLKNGDLYSLSSPPGNDWQTFGTLSLKQGTIEVVPESRIAGSWLVLRKKDGKTAKVSGKWRIPEPPERAIFEGHLLPADPILMVLGMPRMNGTAEAELSWNSSQAPPLSGRLSLIKGTWNEYSFDLIEGSLSGTPGRQFDFNGLKVKRLNELSADGAGSIELFPERKIAFKLNVERLLLSYLKPLGILNDSDVSAAGTLVLSGSPEDPQARGSLVCSPGSVNPRTGFTVLQLNEGRLDLEGKEASLSAELNDIAGAPVLVSGNARLRRLLPETFLLSISAPGPVKIDALPKLYKGTVRGDVRFEGKPDEPELSGEILLEEGRIKSPAAGGEDSEGLARRLSWNLTVRFGKDVQYVIEPLEGAVLDLAKISPDSRVKIRGKGGNFRVYGSVTADEGPLTLFLGKQIWKGEPEN